MDGGWRTDTIPPALVPFLGNSQSHMAWHKKLGTWERLYPLFGVCEYRKGVVSVWSKGIGHHRGRLVFYDHVRSRVLCSEEYALNSLDPQYSTKRRESVAKFLKKAQAKSRKQARESVLADKGFREKYPALTEHLTLVRWEDGSARKTSTITLFAEAGLWKLTLNNREEQEVTFLTGGSLEELLGAVEQGLQTDSLEWRESWEARQSTTQRKRG